MERGFMEQAWQDERDNRIFTKRSPGWRTTLPDPETEARLRRQRRREWAAEQARHAQTGLYTLTLLAGWAINLAARAEPNRDVRRQRRGLLLDTWNRFSGNLGRQTRL